MKVLIVLVTILWGLMLATATATIRRLEAEVRRLTDPLGH